MLISDSNRDQVLCRWIMDTLLWLCKCLLGWRMKCHVLMCCYLLHSTFAYKNIRIERILFIVEKYCIVMILRKDLELEV